MNETKLDKSERSKYQIEMYQAMLAEANAWRAAEKLRKAAQKDRKHHHGGRFDSLEDAERAAIALRNRLFTNNLVDRGLNIE